MWWGLLRTRGMLDRVQQARAMPGRQSATVHPVLHGLQLMGTGACVSLRWLAE